MCGVHNAVNTTRMFGQFLKEKHMRRREVLSSLAWLAAGSAVAMPARAQELVNDESAPLFLTRIIPIPDTPGRFDHMSVDNKGGRVFATVFGNDTVEVLQLERARRIHTI